MLLNSGRLACSLVAAFVALSVLAATPPRDKRPTLVVGIVVDGLSDDYLSLLRSHFGDDGLLQFMNHGAAFTDIEYGDDLDAVASTAIVMSGAAPAVNGIPSNYVYDPATRRTRNILSDAGSTTGASGNLTPTALLVSTLADEIRIDAAGTGTVHAIAPDAERAILMAAHAGNSAMWIDDNTGKWTSSSFYRETPQPVMMRNVGRPLSMALDTMSWTPLRPIDTYPDLPAHKKLYPFRHLFQRGDNNRFTAFKASPLANSAVTDMAVDYIRTLGCGTREATDMLGLGYNLEPYPYTRDADNRVETIDAYLRFDRDIARLLRAIDNGPGRQNTVIFLAGTPAPAASRRDDEKWAIPHGEFSAKKAISLLNMYLIALHGNGEWATGYHNRQIYLNHDHIKASNLDLHTIREQAAEFLSRMSGVSHVYTIDEVVGGHAGDNATSLKRNISLKHAGDLLITINPGWESVDDDFRTDRRVARAAYIPAPLYILAPGVAPVTVDARVDARAIAPTVARLIRIRAPNGASLAPVRL